MKNLLALSLLLTFAALVGCNNKTDDFDTVPPPVDDAAYGQPGDFDPVEITPGADAGGDVQFTQPASVVGMTYTIVKGDTLYSIARRHYGNGNRWPDIVAANPGLEPTRLPVGKVITLP